MAEGRKGKLYRYNGRWHGDRTPYETPWRLWHPGDTFPADELPADCESEEKHGDFRIRRDWFDLIDA